MNSLLSDNYRKLNNTLHTTIPSYGTSGKHWADIVSFLVEETGSHHILDYGCGKQTLQSALPKLKVTGYDPAIESLSSTPKPHDLVVCTDVLEHIEPEYLENVIQDLMRVTNTLGLIVVSTRPAKKILDDGRNAHLIQQPPEYWIAKFEKKFDIMSAHFSERHSELFLIITPSAKLRPVKYALSKIRTLKLRKNMSSITKLLTSIWKISWNGNPSVQ